MALLVGPPSSSVVLFWEEEEEKEEEEEADEEDMLFGFHCLRLPGAHSAEAHMSVSAAILNVSYGSLSWLVGWY